MLLLVGYGSKQSSHTLNLVSHSPTVKQAKPIVEKTLLQRIAHGEGDAAQECVQKYGGLIWSLANTFGISRSDAEDAVQEIFIELWRHAGRFDPKIASEATFVVTLTRRRLIDRRRKQQRRPVESSFQEEAGLTEEAVPSSKISPDPSHCLEFGEEVRRAADYLSRLREDQRGVIELSIFHGLTHEAISSHLDIPLGTVKTHLRRGLARLRELLSHNPEVGLAGGNEQ